MKMVIETSPTIARVAKKLGIKEGTLGNWVGIYRREHAGEEPNGLNLSFSSYGNRQHDQGERSPRFRALVRVGGPGGITGAALGLARV